MTKFIDSLSPYQLLQYYDRYSQKYDNILAEYNAGNVGIKKVHKYLALQEYFFSTLSVRLGGPKTVRSYCHKCFQITWHTDSESVNHYLGCDPKLYAESIKDYLLFRGEAPFFIVAYPSGEWWKDIAEESIGNIIQVGEFNNNKTKITWYNISDVVMPRE